MGKTQPNGFLRESVSGPRSALCLPGKRVVRSLPGLPPGCPIGGHPQTGRQTRTKIRICLSFFGGSRRHGS